MENKTKKLRSQKNKISAQEAVKKAFEYLKSVSPDAEKFSNFRVEEIILGPSGYKVTLGYDITGEFGFDKKREFKQFEIENDGEVKSMTIK